MQTSEHMDALDIVHRIDADDRAIDAAVQVERHARALLRFWHANGRLPWPAATDVREVHRMLEEIIAGMDVKGGGA